MKKKNGLERSEADCSTPVRDQSKENCGKGVEDVGRVWSEDDYNIKQEIIRLMSASQTDINILAAIGSWKDTISDKDVLAMLKSETRLNAFDHA